jgi:hypothetical protein
MPDPTIDAQTIVADAAAEALELLDRLHVIACLLQPFAGDPGNPGFVAREREPDRVHDDGYRMLPYVVAAIDEAINVHEGMTDYHLVVTTCLVPLRWSVKSLSETWRLREDLEGHDLDYPLPTNAADILDYAFDQVRLSAARFREATGL